MLSVLFILALLCFLLSTSLSSTIFQPNQQTSHNKSNPLYSSSNLQPSYLLNTMKLKQISLFLFALLLLLLPLVCKARPEPSDPRSTINNDQEVYIKEVPFTLF